MAAFNSQEASRLHQVMGAQVLPTPVVNGVNPEGPDQSQPVVVDQGPPAEDSATTRTPESPADGTAGPTLSGAVGDLRSGAMEQGLAIQWPMQPL